MILNKRSSKLLRQDQKLLRNEFDTIGKYGMPIIKKCEVDITGIKLIGADHVCVKADLEDIGKTVHFFVEDMKIDKYYSNPEQYLNRLAQYPHLITPDYSLYTEIPMALQIYNTFRSRWCGAYWQSYTLSVIPVVSWSTRKSFEFCFDGIEYKSVVAVSTLGGLKKRKLFLEGYFEMQRRINPRQVLCFGKTFPEMGEEVISVEYRENKRRARLWAAEEETPAWEQSNILSAMN